MPPPAVETHSAYFQLLIDGTAVPDTTTEHIKEISVENTLHLPDVATVRFEDDSFTLQASHLLKIGKSIEIKFGLNHNELSSAFVGEIVAVDHDMAAHMSASFVIRCYDKSHRLHRGRMRRSFQNVKDSDLVQRLAGEVGLTADIAATNEVHPYVFQNNQTNWEFISFLAQRNNFRTYVGGDNKLHFRNVSQAATTDVSMEWGRTLTSFRPRVTSSGQVPKVIVKSWDYGKKEGIVGEATRPQGLPQIGLIENGGHGGEVAKRAFGDATMVIVDRVARTVQAATDYAQSVLDELSAGFVEADGLCQWHKDLKPGCNIECQNLGEHFNGKYYVSSTTHHFSSAEGLTSQFTVSGKKPQTLSSAMGGGIQDPQKLGGSVVIGIVTNNQDPSSMCRVRVKFPSISDSDESFWCRLVSPMAGPGRGFQFIPEVNDEVLVAFENGDINHPYVLGALWNGADAPVEDNSVAVTGGAVQRRTIKTRIGHLMLLDDTDDKGEISFKTLGGHFVCMNDKDEQILVKTKQGHKLLLDDRNQKIELVDMTGSNSMKIDSAAGNIDINCTGNFSVSAAREISLTSGTSTSISVGASYSLTVGATASMDAGATFTITGAMVNIN